MNRQPSLSSKIAAWRCFTEPECRLSPGQLQPPVACQLAAIYHDRNRPVCMIFDRPHPAVQSNCTAKAAARVGRLLCLRSLLHVSPLQPLLSWVPHPQTRRQAQCAWLLGQLWTSVISGSVCQGQIFFSVLLLSRPAAAGRELLQLSVSRIRMKMRAEVEYGVTALDEWGQGVEMRVQQNSSAQAGWRRRSPRSHWRLVPSQSCCKSPPFPTTLYQQASV